ncbi:MAG TPA: hypothetical protein VIS96_03955 [Terrimicrobiaceae bacterium]
MPEHFIPPHGGYEDLLSFQKARIVYDGTVRFVARFLEKRDRTCDQMVQAARSGKQNYETFKKGIEHPDPAIAANVMIA